MSLLWSSVYALIFMVSPVVGQRLGTPMLKDVQAHINMGEPKVVHQYSRPQSQPPSPFPFNALAADNIAVYVGHSPGNFNTSLPALCNDATIDLIMISFIRTYNGLNSLSTFDFAADCDSRKVTNHFAPFSCPELASQIAQCQAQGKKILASVGGSTSNTTFPNQQQAIDAATTLWNVFGEGTATPSLRPFGDVILDGIDIDQEGSNATTYFDIFATTIKNYWMGGSRPYYLTAAPLCANTSALPSEFYAQTDFIFVRFYNARLCNIGTPGFLPSVVAWKTFLNSLKTSPSQLFPRFYIGGLSFDNLDSGYLTPDKFSTWMLQGANASRDIFGGVMLWDGTNGETTVGTDGQTFLSITKEALRTPPTSLNMYGWVLAKLWDLARNVTGLE